MLLLFWQVFTKCPRSSRCYKLLPDSCRVQVFRAQAIVWIPPFLCRLPSPVSNRLGDVHWGSLLSLFYFPLDIYFFPASETKKHEILKMNGHINPFFSVNWKAKMSLYLMPGQCFSVFVFLDSFTCSQCIVKVIIQSKCLFLQMNI